MKLTHLAIAGLSVALAAALYLTLNADMDERLSAMQTNNDKKLQEIQDSLKDLKNRPAPAPVKDAVAAVSAKARAAAGEAEAAAKEAANDLRDAAGATLDKAKAAVEENIDDAAGAVADKGEAVARGVAKTVRTKAEELAAAARGKVQTEPPLLTDDQAADPEAARIAREERNILNATGVGMDRVAIETADAANAVPADKPLNQLQSLIASQPAIARIKQADKRSDEFVVLDAGMNAKLMRGDRFAVRRGTAIIARLTIGETIKATESIADVDRNTLVAGMVLEPGDEIIKYDR